LPLGLQISKHALVALALEIHSAGTGVRVAPLRLSRL